MDTVFPLPRSVTVLTVTLPLVPVPVVDPMFRSVPVMVSPPESVKTAATLTALLAV
jgi:hypothetical protein